MARPRKLTPTDGELKILQAVWQVGPGTLRDIRDAIPEADRPSVAAMAQAAILMVEKNLIRVADAKRPQKFVAVETQKRTYESLVKDLQNRVFGGSLRQLVLHALGGKKSGQKELDEVRSLIDQMRNEDEQSEPPASTGR